MTAATCCCPTTDTIIITTIIITTIIITTIIITIIIITTIIITTIIITTIIITTIIITTIIITTIIITTIIITTIITMKNHFDPARHHRRSIRLKGYDYSREGAYFITTCTYNRQRLFGEIHDRIMLLNDCGLLVQSIWDGLPKHYPHLQLDTFIIMPDHIHGIIVLMDDDDTINIKTVESVGAGFKPALPPTRHALSEIIRAFKTFSARAINRSRGITGLCVWERNYYEHIIRNEQSLNRIRSYIERNPAKWG